jgi:MFS family permease
MMVPVGRLTLVRTFPKFELVQAMSFVAIPGLIGPMLGPVAGGFIVHYFHWRTIFFLNIPFGIVGLILVYLRLPDYQAEETTPLDIVGLILFGAGLAVLSYVLEIFGEHSLNAAEVSGLLAIAAALLLGYALHANKTDYPILQLALFRIRTFATSVSGSFFTRLGIGGVPFLLPLLYQEGLALSPIQSGLLIAPQALAALSTKFFMPDLLRRLGYRKILISNTVALGLMLMLFATVGRHTPIWLILVQAFCYGALASIRNTSMNTLAYADVPTERASNASSIASTVQQLSTSFGVAIAGLTAAFFLPDRNHASPGQIISGIHGAFLVLGAFTILSTIIFWRLKSDDGADEEHADKKRS